MSKKSTSADWRQILRRKLPLLGHRNWIVIADAAYPQQTSPGIETIVAEEDLGSVLARTMKAIAKAPHVRPMVHLDAELAFLTEKSAPGIGDLRKAIDSALGDAPVLQEPHDAIIARLDEAGRNFNILLIKTTETIPYTSVFVELDCGYWDVKAETRLRAAMKRRKSRS